MALTVVRGWWREIRDAAQFLTVVPLRPAGSTVSDGSLVCCIRMFPAVGTVIGAGGALVLVTAAALGMPPAIAALLALASLTLITGALHEDGLADFADGLGGGRNRDDKLRIMRDSATGSFGVLAVVFAVGLRVAAVADLETAGGGAALIACGAVSRVPLVAILRGLTPARASGLTAGAGRPSRAAVVQAAAIGGVVAFLALPPAAAIAVILAAAAGAGAVSWLADRQLGGHTGDVLGAAQQGAETAALVALAGVL